jgi:hypothetical protein
MHRKFDQVRRRTIMRKVLLGVLALGAAIATPMAASAASDNHTTLPTTNSSNCLGQAVTWLVQGNNPSFPGPGLGNVNKQYGTSVQDLQSQRDAFCASLPLP